MLSDTFGIQSVVMQISKLSQVKYQQKINAIHLSQDGRLLAVAAEKKVWLDDVEKNQRLQEWTLPLPASNLAIGADNKNLVVATNSPSIFNYSLSSLKLANEIRRDDAIGSFRNTAQKYVTLYDGGERVVSSGPSNRIVVSNTQTARWEHIMFVKYSGECAVASSFDGRYVCVFGEENKRELSGHISLFRVRRGLQPMWTAWHKSRQAVTSVAFDSGDEFVASCGARDGVRVWDCAKGEEHFHVAPESGFTKSAWFVDGARNLVTMSESTMKLWQLQDASEVVDQYHLESADWKRSAVSRNGKDIWLASDNTIAHFRIE